MIIRKVRYICRTEPEMKNSRLFTELFQWTKRCAGKICEYGGKNKSGLLAEKKPAYSMAGKKFRPITALNSVNRHKLFIAQK